MRLSQFNELMIDEFGPDFADVIFSDLALAEFQDQTAEAAISGGEEPKEVWLAICRAQGVPKNRWHGKNKKPNSNI